MNLTEYDLEMKVYLVEMIFSTESKFLFVVRDSLLRFYISHLGLPDCYAGCELFELMRKVDETYDCSNQKLVDMTHFMGVKSNIYCKTRLKENIYLFKIFSDSFSNILAKLRYQNCFIEVNKSQIYFFCFNLLIQVKAPLKRKVGIIFRAHVSNSLVFSSWR